MSPDVKAAAEKFAAPLIAQGFKPQALHEYQDENGAPVYWKVRLKHPDTGEKWIRPMHLNGHGYELGKPSFKDGDRLYRLPDIIANPAAVIWITEGEWAADWLHRKFKQLGVDGQNIATTSGGATSAGGSHWAPLRGHDVRIWPDNDAEGLRYAREVAAILHTISCQVRQIDIASLRLAEHADAVDWLESHPEATRDELLGLPVAEAVFADHDAESDESPTGPPRINSLAFHGILKHIVELATRNSEASPVAVAANTIAFFSAMIGRAAYQWIGDAKIHARPFFLIVGSSAKSRKGTAEKLPRRLFKKVDEFLTDRLPDYSALTVHGGGLSSGEGIAYAIRDASDKADKVGNSIDSGVPDKRLLVIETEFANVLANSRRETSTLSAVVRNLWDGHNLAPLTKNNRTCASNPHVALIGHITVYELVQKIQQLEISNGLLNRFLIVHVQRDKLVALPKPTPEAEIHRIAERLARAVEFATTGCFGACDTLSVTMSDDASRLWVATYPEISRDIPGIIGELTGRGETYVLLLAMVFALMDRSAVIEPQHLKAAIYWLDYVKDSIQYIFRKENEQGELDELEAFAQEMILIIAGLDTASRTDINNAFHRHKTATELNEVLQYLLTATPARIEAVKQKTSGRTRTVYRLVAKKAD